MIKLLAILFIFKSLYSEQNTYHFPDQHSRFLHILHQSFKTSSSIVIITPSLHHSALKKELQNVSHHGCNVSLYLNNLDGDPLSMVQYQNINLYHAPLLVNQTIILVGKSLVCTLSAPIDEERFSTEQINAQCNDSTDTLRDIQASNQLILLHSESYLK